MYKRVFAAALVFGAAALAPPLQAQSMNCMPREMLVENLKSQFGEHLSGGGLQSSQQLLEVWTSPETGSFTVLITRANGLSCVVATGQNWNSAVMPKESGVAG